MRYLFFLIIVVPAIEIGLFILSGKLIGVFPTICLIIFTGILGAYLAKKQGIETLRRLQEDLRSGRMPGEAITDGVCILSGGIFLITPGFITDILGLLLLMPATRKWFKPLLYRIFRKWMRRKTVILR
ncbi:FxsA family protein [Heyndrickxia acidicola]|uniref:Membrane protein FxsA n=1 Tax=Heyndrickxia acidicola TaxID=209389 RepID=A0ABU6MEW4_9BACI|nr:FxsA family protein [Heyndrickxia acidicola]MED1203215.1 membrane protein FxsA [Heyndrickxia acidicola]